MIDAREPIPAAVHVRAVVVEDHGDDLVIEFAAPRGATRIQVGRSQIVSVEEMARHAIVSR